MEGVKRQTPKYAAKIYSFEWITKHFFAKFLNRFNIIFNQNSIDLCHGWFKLTVQFTDVSIRAFRVRWTVAPWADLKFQNMNTEQMAKDSAK